jgi:hypothetical protein
MPRNWENKSAKLNRVKYVKLYLRLGIVSGNLSLFFIVLRICSAHNYDELIGMLKGGLKEVIEEWTRDELSRSFLKLISKEPRLITLGAKAMLRSMFQ